MDEQSLDDLLAFIELRNITLAANHRNISQPAYSRRLKAIEDRFEIPLVDRSGRPSLPTQALSGMRDEIELALASLKRVNKCLSHSSASESVVSIAATHSLSSGLLPIALAKAQQYLKQPTFRIQSANQDICYQLLMTEQVSMMFAFETAGQQFRSTDQLVEKTNVTTDLLVPVCTPELASKTKTITPGKERIPLLSYPTDNFFGRVLYNEVLVHSPHIYSKTIISGLTSLLLCSAKSGQGIAWLPLSIIKEELRNRQLVTLEGYGFPAVALNVSLLRLKTKDLEKLSPIVDSLVNSMSGAISE